MKAIEFQSQLAQKGIQLSEEQLAQFKTYFDWLIEWNQKINLTAVVEEEEVYVKHFYDSITPAFYLPELTNGGSLIDVGAGAGFPSIPLKICFPALQVTIVDSLQKRILFLQQLIEALQLKDVQAIHARAEEIGHKDEHREAYHWVTARAVANLSTLSEYCLPLVKLEGHFLALKGSKAEEELEDAKYAIGLLGGQVEEYFSFSLPEAQGERTILKISKKRSTPKKYPRKAGLPAKQPLHN